jgi:hypothetical protein
MRMSRLGIVLCLAVTASASDISFPAPVGSVRVQRLEFLLADDLDASGEALLSSLLSSVEVENAI